MHLDSFLVDVARADVPRAMVSDIARNPSLVIWEVVRTAVYDAKVSDKVIGNERFCSTRIVVSTELGQDLPWPRSGRRTTRCLVVLNLGEQQLIGTNYIQ